MQADDKSAGYHGYWITDFTQIDPHLGTNEELRGLIDDAHSRGMKVFFDIITNHTADVIDYREAKRPAYVSKDVKPYRDASGRPFDDRDYAGTNRFPSLSPSVSFPFTPFVPAGEPRKVPEWLNDVTLYHNRGNTTFVGENSQYGDFFGLDDLFTEHPRVVRGMTDIYNGWIRDFGIDGFRIDTMKHVDDDFWKAFAPDVLRYAQRQGKREFFMFGEVFDTSRPYTSHFTTSDRVQAVLDFPFQAAAQSFAAGSGSTDALRDLFLGDDWYTDADSNAYQLPTFLGNHDMGRIGNFIRGANSGADDAEVLARDRLAHALMYLSRGNPVIYYGDEQGFVGDGGDQLARQDMFPSQVPEYNDDDLIGTDATTAEENFDTTHPLYTGIGALARLTREHRGAAQRRAAAPPLQRDGRRRVRVLAPRPLERPRVRRGAQQRRGAAHGVDPDLQRARLVRPALRRERRGRADRLGEAAYRDGPAAVGGRVPRRPAARAQLARTGRLARAAAARARAARGRRERRRRRVQRGDVPGQGPPRRLAADRHRRQPALPRLPRRLRAGAGHPPAVPRGRAGQRGQHAP